MASKRSTPYQMAHGHKYGVRICQRTTDSTQEVLAAECLFCIFFGREVKVGSKRKATGNVKYFRNPFRADNYKQHLTSAHPEKWKEYEGLDDERKKEFFCAQTPIKSSIHGYFGSQQVSVQIFI